MSLDRTNTRTMRGEYWLLASWIATIVVANTTPRNVSMAAATVAATAASAVGSPGRTTSTASCTSLARSTARVTRDSTPAPSGEAERDEPQRAEPRSR